MTDNFKSQEKIGEYYNGLSKKGTQSPQKEIPSVGLQAKEVRDRLQLLNESFDKSLNSLSPLCRQYATGILQLSKIFAVLQTETEVRQGVLSISLPLAVKEVELYISECLADLLSKKRDTSHIPYYVRIYKVVTPLPGGKCSVSLPRIHLILQDNFQGSSLCSLFDVIRGCYHNVETKVVDF